MGAKVGMIAFGIAGVLLLLWINWPSSPSSRGSVSSDNEDFNPPDFRPPALSDTSQQASQPIDQIVVPEGQDQAGDGQQAENVDQTVQEGVDLDAERRAIEARMAQEEARRKAEEEEARRRSEAEEAERKKQEEEKAQKAIWDRLRSPQMVTSEEGGSSAGGKGVGGETQIAADGQIVSVPGADSDPNKAFLAQSEASVTAMARACVPAYRCADCRRNDDPRILGNRNQYRSPRHGARSRA